MTASETQVLAYHSTRQGAERLREMVGAAPVARLLGLESSPEDFERKAVKLQPDVLFMEVGLEMNGQADLLERLRRTVPRGMVVALSASKEPELILEAMRLGVREFLAEPVPMAAFNDALLRLARQASHSGQPSGRLLGLMGVKGGVGTSQCALNLAWSLSRDPAMRVALVDLDLAAGDLALLLDVEPSRDASDVSANFDRLDAVLTESLLTQVSPGFSLLAAPADPVTAEDIRAEHVGRALDHLCDTHQLVIADLPSRLDEVCLMALDRSDAVLLVVEPTVVGLKGARRFLTLSERLGHPEHKVHVVINRHGARGCLPKAEVTRALGRPVLAYLPNDSRVLMEAANSGCPALRDWPKAPWSKAMDALAHNLPLTAEEASVAA